MFKKPIKDRTYVVQLMCPRGVDKDYSAFTIFDVTKMPFKVVAIYKNNEIKPFVSSKCY